MPKLMEPPPYTSVEPVTEILHGVPVTDPYRWLEEQESPRTRAWIAAQARFARCYLDGIVGRQQIRKRIRELLDVETCDSILKSGNRYFFRKRLLGQEQPCTYFREDLEGHDQLLIDPGKRGTGRYPAVKPLCVSPDGRLLLYEVKEGGERTATFEPLEIESRRTLPDVLPRGFTGVCVYPGFASAFITPTNRLGRATQIAGLLIGTRSAPACGTTRRSLWPGKTSTYGSISSQESSKPAFLYGDFWKPQSLIFICGALGSCRCGTGVTERGYMFVPILLDDGRILAITDSGSPNFRIVEVHPRNDADPTFTRGHSIERCTDPELGCGWRAGRRLLSQGRKTEIEIFDLWGNRIGRLPSDDGDTLRIVGASESDDEIFLERESFAQPIQLYSYSARETQLHLWARREVPFESSRFAHVQVWFPARMECESRCSWWERKTLSKPVLTR